jgi:hypothetical protein
MKTDLHANSKITQSDDFLRFISRETQKSVTAHFRFCVSDPFGIEKVASLEQLIVDQLALINAAPTKGITDPLVFSDFEKAQCTANKAIKHKAEWAICAHMGI